MKIKLKKTALDRFRKIARSTKLEVQAYLVGTIVSPFLVTVDYLAYPKVYGFQTKCGVAWTSEEYNELKRKAEYEGKSIVGDIHSHPAWFPIKSPQDHKAQIQEQLRVCGICSVFGKKTTVAFWLADSSLPLEVIHK